EAALRRMVEVLKAVINANEKIPGTLNQGYLGQFSAFIEDDLDTPKAIACVHEMLKDESLSLLDKKMTLLRMNMILGFLGKHSPVVIPMEIEELVRKREQAREEKDWKEADGLRNKVKNLGYDIKDTSNGPILYPLQHNE
ncbi:MAG: hypothetical protein HYY60_01970, partial [Parcubacteria group bacterium]|nr:hypothetical protein [Parcubacteria group bacterium]